MEPGHPGGVDRGVAGWGEPALGLDQLGTVFALVVGLRLHIKGVPPATT